MEECSSDKNHGCVGFSSKTHEEIVIKLTRIEAGQKHLCQIIDGLNKAMAKVSVQEERQINFQSRLDAAWNKIDVLKETHDKCPICNLQTQVGWIWVFLSSLALGLTMLFVTGVINK